MRRILAAFLLHLAMGPPVHADGGAVRFAGPVGDYQVTILTSPEPLVTGTVEVSLSAQDRHSGRVRDVLAALVTATASGSTTAQLAAQTQPGLSTNPLFHSALVRLDQPGEWKLSVEFQDPAGLPPIRFSVFAFPPPPPWRALAGWIVLPAAPILLFLLVEHSRSRRGRPARRGGS